MAALIFPIGFYINEVGGQPYKLPNNTVVGSSYVLFVLSIFFTIVGLLFAGKVCLPGWGLDRVRLWTDSGGCWRFYRELQKKTHNDWKSKTTNSWQEAWNREFFCSCHGNVAPPSTYLLWYGNKVMNKTLQGTWANRGGGWDRGQLRPPQPSGIKCNRLSLPPSILVRAERPFNVPLSWQRWPRCWRTLPEDHYSHFSTCLPTPPLSAHICTITTDPLLFLAPLSYFSCVFFCCCTFCLFLFYNSSCLLFTEVEWAQLRFTEPNRWGIFGRTVSAHLASERGFILSCCTVTQSQVCALETAAVVQLSAWNTGCCGRKVGAGEPPLCPHPTPAQEQVAARDDRWAAEWVKYN